MSAVRKEQGSTRQSLLQLLRRHGQMTALEMSDALNIGAVGIRQHLALLERDRLVQIVGVRRNVGRPSHLYALTEEAERHFPKQYADLALDVLDYVALQGGDSAVTEVFQMRRTRLRNLLDPLVADKDRAAQVAELANVLKEHGYMCEFYQNSDGSFELIEYNCPVDCVARRYPQICAQEIILYEELLGAPVTRETTISEGDFCCRYHIPA